MLLTELLGEDPSLCLLTSRRPAFHGSIALTSVSIFIFMLSFFQIGPQYVARVGLKFVIFQPQLSECWDHRHMAPHLAVSIILVPGVIGGQKWALDPLELEL